MTELTMETETDDRFTVITHDPRFRKIPQNVRKVKIDKRFHGMFKDKSFKLKYSVDKRGRPVRLTSNENLRRFYDLSSSSDSENEESEQDAEDADPSPEDEPVVQKSLQKSKKRLSGKQRLKEELMKRKKKRKSERVTPKKSKELSPRQPAVGDAAGDNGDLDQDTSDSDDDDPSRRHLSNRKEYSLPRAMDLARGQGNQDSSSDSDSDSDYGSSGSDGEGSETEVKWGELDKDAPRSSNESSRLALCNMDWDRVTASDLLVLFNSFKPTGGVVHSVKVCPSDFGLEKMREEDARGPLELTETENGHKDAFVEDDHRLQMKLRKYQLQRLKYYFAVIECDSVATASAVYEHCDGMEYLSSSTRLDLRFILDDVTFEKEEPKDVATDMPDASLYKPMDFRTTALHQSRVELTWDETNHHRTVKTAEAFKKKSIEEMDVSAFLASSSDDNDEEGDQWEFAFEERKEQEQNQEKKEHAKAPLSEDQQIAKYRALLKEVDKGQQTDRDKQMEMKITWEPGLKDATEELIKKKSEKPSESTPWENFLEKKKDKKKKQKGLKKRLNEAKEHSDAAFSDDELPPGVDLDDPFFKDALREDGVEGIKKKSKKMKGKKQEAEVDDEERERIKQKQSELELLFMDEDDGKKHFNLKAIMDNEKNQGKKMKRKKKRKLQQEETAKYEDDFEIDVKDQRFQAMFTSHLYAMDPSDPQFKKTNATEALLAERQVQREKEQEQRRSDTTMKESTVTSKTVPKATPKATPQSEVSTHSSRGAELSMLVKSVKNKTNQFKAQKLKRQKAH